MKMWHMHDHTTKEQAEINRAKINNGKILSMENPTKTNDAYDDSRLHSLRRMENTSETDDVINDGDELPSGSMVHESRCRCNDTAGCVCVDGCRCNDGCLCGMDGARE